jgi:dienelactone hydrolase
MHRMGISRAWRTGAAAVAVGVLLTACTGGGDGDGAATNAPPASSPATVEPAATGVAFTDCGEACEGEIDGARYRILLPSSWNGTLLLYSHGYRNPLPAPPDFAAPSVKADPSPGYNDGGVPLARALLSQGYALAGSSWASNGWAVSDGVAAGEDLYARFVEEVGEPQRVYAWGDSLGGLVTMELAERNPTWISGAAPLCGVMAGIVPNMDLALDVAYAIRELLVPELQLTGYASGQDAGFEWVDAARAIQRAAADPEQQADVLALGLVVDAPMRTKTQDGSSVDSQVLAAAESALIGLRFGTVGRWDIEQRYGGNISENTDTDYAARLSVEDRELLDEVGGAGTAERIIAALEGGERVDADRSAVRAARKDGGEPSGTIEVPTLTLHTAADPLVGVQNQAYLRDASGDTDQLVQLFTVAPDTYPSQPGAPYGAGHCDFTPDSRVGVIDLLDQWVRAGQAPTPAAVEAAFGAESGFDPAFQPPAWPQ